MTSDERITTLVRHIRSAVKKVINAEKRSLRSLYAKNETKQYEAVFTLALRKALRESEHDLDKPKRFLHLFCGRTFATKEEALRHHLF